MTKYPITLTRCYLFHASLSHSHVAGACHTSATKKKKIRTNKQKKRLVRNKNNNMAKRKPVKIAIQCRGHPHPLFPPSAYPCITHATDSEDGGLCGPPLFLASSSLPADSDLASRQIGTRLRGGCRVSALGGATKLLDGGGASAKMVSRRAPTVYSIRRLPRQGVHIHRPSVNPNTVTSARKWMHGWLDSARGHSVRFADDGLRLSLRLAPLPDCQLW